jgi:ferredoxin
LWEGLRNPAIIGLYPAGLRDIWEYYSNRRKQKVDESGRNTIFQVPRSFEYTLKNFRRAVIVSVMLPFSLKIVHDYVDLVIDKKKGSSHKFINMYERMNKILDKAITRTAIGLVTDDSERVVVAMNTETVKAVSTEAVPQTRQGASHGPSKGGNYPQKSIAALLGLGQFGVSRIIIRDELVDNKVERFAGPIRSIIIFDKEPLVTDGRGSIIYPTSEWRQFLLQLYDFTSTGKDINTYRLCTHIPLNDKGCSKCSDSCPSGAQANSLPDFEGKYSERVSKQANRFWESKLQFDANRCVDERGQMSGLLPEWSCARCVTVCIDQGIRRKQAVQAFQKKLSELTKKA